MATSIIQAINGIVDVSSQISLTVGTGTSGTVTLLEAKKVGNILYLLFVVVPSSTLSAGANFDVKLSGATPAIGDDSMVGLGIRGRTGWMCWIKAGSNKEILRIRKVSDDTWAADTAITINTQFPVY